MKEINKRMLVFLCVISFLSLPLLGTNSTTGKAPINKQSFVINSADLYVEDFSTTTFNDAGATSAFGWGTGAISNNRNFTWVGLDYYYTASPVVDVDVQGRKAYIGMYNTGASDQIAILDINDPNIIRLLGTSSDHEKLRSLAVDGDVLFTGQDSVVGDAIIVYNVTNPFNPGWTVGYGTTNHATDIDVEGHLIYHTAYNQPQSLRILTYEGPGMSNHERIVTNWNVSKALGLDIEGQVACIAASDEGFYTLNVSEKYLPVELGYVDTPGNATDVLYEGRFAYIADGPAGIHIIDLQDLANPTVVGSFDTPGYAYNLVKQGTTLFVADGMGGIIILDIANPSKPVFVTEIDLGVEVLDLDLYGGDLVVGTEIGVYTITQGYLGNFAVDWYEENIFSTYEVWDIIVRGDIAYVAGGPDGFYTLNVRDPRNPQLLDRYVPGSLIFMKEIAIQGDFVYTLHDTGMHTFDVSDPNNIKLTRFEGGTDLEDITLSGPIAYVAYGDPSISGFATLNYTYNFNPGFVANNALGTNITSITVQGNLVYTGDNTATTGTTPYIHKIDGSVFTPIAISSYGPLSERTNGITVDGDLMYLSDNYWLVLFNITDPFNVVRYGDVRLFDDTTTYVKSFGASYFGPYLMSAAGENGAYLLDSKNYLSTMIFSGSRNENATGARKITTAGDYCYVANKSNLIILRHYKSTGATFHTGTSIVQSTAVDNLAKGLITSATLSVDHHIPFDTHIDYYMSADGGAHWEAIVPGANHTFVNQGEDLLWRAEITGPEEFSAYIYEVHISYVYNAAPSAPVLEDPGETSLGRVVLNWSTSIDDEEVEHYELQVADSLSFTGEVENYTLEETTKSFFGLPKGKHYFRVKAVDNQGLSSDWSNPESIEVTFSLLSPLWLGIFGGILLLVIGGVIVVVLLVMKKKKVPTR